MSKSQATARTKGAEPPDPTSENPNTAITADMLTQILSAFTTRIADSNQQIIDQLARINENLAQSHSVLTDTITNSQRQIIKTVS